MPVRSRDDWDVSSILKHAAARTHVRGALSEGAPVLEKACQRSALFLTRRGVIEHLQKQTAMGVSFKDMVFPSVDSMEEEETCCYQKLSQKILQAKKSAFITHMDDWLCFATRRVSSLRKNTFKEVQAEDFERLCGELAVAHALAVGLNEGESVAVCGDARPTWDARTQHIQPSFDLAIEDSRGALLRGVEATTVEKPFRAAYQLRNALEHGQKKFVGKPTGFQREVAVRVSFAPDATVKEVLADVELYLKRWAAYKDPGLDVVHLLNMEGRMLASYVLPQEMVPKGELKRCLF